MQRDSIKRRSPSEFIIKIENDGLTSMRGSIEHIHSGQVYHFEDFISLVMVAQQKLDKGLRPQCDSELRRFE